jgi:SAM-dependent methyltransferase
VSQDERRTRVETLRAAQEVAFGPDEYVEQESFVRASEILTLAERAGISSSVSVLDLCCGVAGPGRFVTRELSCIYLGVDSSESAIAIATERAFGLPCRFKTSEVPPLPSGTFDVVLLLETMLAFRDKEPLLEAIAHALPAGGRFAFTLEEGVPLRESERARMPASDTVWLTPLDEMHTLLAQAGLVVRWEQNWSESHREMSDALIDAYTADSTAIASRIGRRTLDELVDGHRLWTEWLAAGRVRKFGLVAERAAEKPTAVVQTGERTVRS